MFRAIHSFNDDYGFLSMSHLSIAAQSEHTPIGNIVRGSSARTAAALMHYGNIAAIILIPLIIFWWGASMLVYAMNRHHPNPKVGHYTQRAAVLLYGFSGFFIVIANVIPHDDWTYYLLAWAAAALTIIPWSVRELIHIYQDEWLDIRLDDNGVPE